MRVDYSAYLLTDEWQERRGAAIERAGRNCERCHSRKHLEVHHRTYARLGAELPGDLEVLCAPCHERHHNERRAALGLPPKPTQSMDRIRAIDDLRELARESPS